MISYGNAVLGHSHVVVVVQWAPTKGEQSAEGHDSVLHRNAEATESLHLEVSR